MTIEGNHIFALTQAGEGLARRIADRIGGIVIGKKGRCDKVDQLTDDIGESIRLAFHSGKPVIGIMASGALIRILAAQLNDKQSEPPVIAVSEDGKSVVPLLGGHHGANVLAREIAELLGARAAITTAGDLRFNLALDEPPSGWELANPGNAKRAMADLLAGESVCLSGEAAQLAGWLEQSGLPIDPKGRVRLVATTQDHQVQTGMQMENTLVYVPRLHVLGMGCERGVPAEEAIALAGRVLEDNDISPLSLAAVASIDLKADETALNAVADYYGVPAVFYDAERLEAETPRLENPSDLVFAEVGCHGVAEAAALAGVGEGGVLTVPKTKSKRVTAAIGRAAGVLNMHTQGEGRQRGHLFVVGIGPGQEAWRSPEVSGMIGRATDLVGYSLYLDLIADISSGKERHDFDLGKEEDRVRHAMELAGTGRDVALVCSGDAGIYAMATLVFELLKNGGLSDAAQRIGIAVSPGISALQAAAARAGAPLGHDFCTISLSDLLTPWEAIKMRVKAAAEGDFVIAFYNPVSKRRRSQLAHAKEVLLAHRPVDTPVILATDLGRPKEKVRVVPLAELNIDDVDMLTVVLVGSSKTQTVQTGDGKTWVYTPRGYSAKEGSGIGATS